MTTSQVISYAPLVNGTAFMGMRAIGRNMWGEQDTAWIRAVDYADLQQELIAARDQLFKLRAALAAADVMAHTLYQGGPHQTQYASFMDAYWEARGGSDACVVCSPGSAAETSR